MTVKTVILYNNDDSEIAISENQLHNINIEDVAMTIKNKVSYMQCKLLELVINNTNSHISEFLECRRINKIKLIFDNEVSKVILTPWHGVKFNDCQSVINNGSGTMLVIAEKVTRTIMR